MMVRSDCSVNARGRNIIVDAFINSFQYRLNCSKCEQEKVLWRERIESVSRMRLPEVYVSRSWVGYLQVNGV